MSILDYEVSKIRTGGALFTCERDTPLGVVIDLMAEKQFGSVCIVDENEKAIGIFTERDFLMKIGSQATPETFKNPIETYMTPKPMTVKESVPIRQCFGIMRLGKFRHLIVTNEDGHPQRMISLRDGFFFLCDSL